MRFLMTLAVISSAAAVLLAGAAAADVPGATVKSLGAPDSIQTNLGTLEFKDGVPSAVPVRVSDGPFCSANFEIPKSSTLGSGPVRSGTRAM